MCRTTRAQRPNLALLRKRLNILSYNGLVKFYDITTLAKILSNRDPENLYKYLKLSSLDSRNAGICTVKYIAKSRKSRESFLFRSTRFFNNLPLHIRLAYNQPSFKDKVREYLMLLDRPPDFHLLGR